jgi:hypothetical protein
VHGSTHLLALQIDAAINSGNSGGPVFNEEGQLVGMAFQSFAGTDIENVGWVIPSSVIGHFLEDYERNARYTGFPLLGVTWQGVESRALKRHLRMKVRPWSTEPANMSKFVCPEPSKTAQHARNVPQQAGTTDNLQYSDIFSSCLSCSLCMPCVKPWYLRRWSSHHCKPTVQFVQLDPFVTPLPCLGLGRFIGPFPPGPLASPNW